MGTALTGSSVASTYDALLKITDNGPVGVTAKVVTDGLGNDSCFKLGTTSAEFTGALTGTSASFSSTLAAGNTTITGTLGTTGKITVTGANVRLSNNFSLSGNLVAGTEVALIGRNASDKVVIDADQYGTLICGGVGSYTSTGLSVTGTLGASGNVWSGNNGFSVGTGTTDGAYMTSGGALLLSRNGDNSIYVRRRSSDGSVVAFNRDTTQVGSISVTTTSTAYNTSSDARLKTNIRDLSDSGIILDALKPRLFDWKSGEKDSYGFIAQEVYSVFPQAVTKGDDGETVTQQWAMDPAKLVPVLTAEIKSLRARVAALEAA